jgi:hypothetical protein
MSEDIEVGPFATWLRRGPYGVERRGERFYIVKRGVGDIGHSDSRKAARVYARQRNREMAR